MNRPVPRAALLAIVLGLVASAPISAQSAAPTVRQLALADTIARFTDSETGGARQLLSSIVGNAAGEAGARAATVMQQFMEKYLPADTLRAIAVEDLVATYSGDELAQLLQFYRSDLGRKMLRQLPQTATRGQARLSRIFLEHREEMIRMMMEAPPRDEP